MPQKPQITRYAVFTVSSTNPNQYGDLMVKDTAGTEYKISNKRNRLFEAFQIGAEVKVGYAVYMEREYIASAEQTGKHIASTISTKEEKPVAVEVKSRSEEIETNMWYKIASEMVGNEPLMAYIEANFKSGKLFRKAVTLAVITKMLSILPIKLESKEP